MTPPPTDDPLPPPTSPAVGGDPAGDAGSAADASKLDEIRAARADKVRRLREAGIEPYATGFEPTHTLVQIRAWYPELPAGTETGDEVVVAGRLVARRGHGRLTFLVLREDGADLQLFCPAGALDEASRDLLELLDVGDWVGARGEVMVTNTGELSVRPTTLTLLSKGLRPLPDKWHGLADTEERVRQRELDLVVNEAARRTFAVRAAVLRSLRAELERRGFVEVETPMLHPIPGGAAARPFVTHHNALDVDLYLRIAPELYLKRLIVGGMRRVYEINRSFRNEGMSPRHNPEFTMLEAYAAYDDYHGAMALTEALVTRAALEVCETTELTYQDRELSLASPFRRATLLELTREATGAADLDYDTPPEEVRALCDVHEVPWEPSWGTGKLIVELYEKLVEHTLWEPTFVLDHPVETSPLARRHRDDPRVTERFELIVAGRELANAFSELVDPADQRERFEAQARAREAGDDEAMVVDEPYLWAMELGMPPTGGMGLGVDRLVMLLADVTNIREVILFPTLRPRAGLQSRPD